MIVVHQAGEPRNDGSQLCSRCGLEISRAGHRDHWPVGDYIEVDEQEGGGVTMKALKWSSGDGLPLCLNPAPPDTQRHRPNSSPGTNE